MNKKELKELIKQLVQEYTGTGDSGGNSTDGNDIPSPRPFADDEEELENYLHKNIYGGEGNHYRKDKVSSNPNRHPQTRFEQLDPKEMERFQDKKIQLQKQLANVDIEISQKTLSSLSAASVKQLSTTIDALEKSESDMANAIKEKSSLRNQENQLNNELQELEKLELGVDITQAEKDEKKKEIEERLAKIKESKKATAEKIKQAKQAKQQVMDQRNQINKALGQQKSAIQKQISMQKKAVNQIGKTKPGQEIQEQAYGSATLTTQGPSRTGAIAPTDEYPFSRRPKRTATGMMENEKLNEFTDYGQEGRYPKKEKPGDMFQQKEVEDMFPNGMASRSDKAFQDRVKQHADWTEQASFNSTFVHMQYHETEGLEDKYFIYQTQHYNGNYDDFRNPKFTLLSITKNKDTENEEDLVEYIVDTKAYVKDLEDLRKKGVLGDKVMENINEMNACQTCGEQGHDSSHHKQDHEGKMAKSQLYKIHQYAERLMYMIPDDAQLPAWVQAKFTKAAHSIGAAFHYLDYETMSYHDNLMENIDSYKREVLMEGTMKKFFEMFNQGKTNEEVLRHYAGRGVSIPEAFLSKARKQYEGLKKQKLEIEFSEQEAKDFKPAPMIQEPAEENKKLSSRLTKEKLDPVGQEDGDIDNDGDEDKTDQYLLKKRKAVSKAIKKQKGGKS